ncbi:hypothetical protein DL95DRAFT_37969 [Leptodontidium sp. 2 PMI_412]|nr:hypothetical protein DL95DRAFT_37969 [Leptodontidium sp. 2 PMI_412]
MGNHGKCMDGITGRSAMSELLGGVLDFDFWLFSSSSSFLFAFPFARMRCWLVDGKRLERNGYLRGGDR